MDQKQETKPDDLQAQKADIEAKLKAARHAVWMLEIDLKAIQKKIDGPGKKVARGT